MPDYDPLYYVGVEFTPGSYTNISDDVLKAQIDRSMGSIFNSLQPGSCEFELINSDGRYNPGRTDGPYGGLIRPQLGAKVMGTYPVNSQYGLNFTGSQGLVIGSLTNAASDSVIGSFVVDLLFTNPASFAAISEDFFNKTATGGISLARFRTGRLDISARTAAGSVNMSFFSNSDQLIVNPGRYQIAGHWNLTTSKCMIFINDSPASMSAALVNDAFPLVYNAQPIIGNDGQDPFVGDMYAFSLYDNVAIDFSQESNRRAFFTSSGDLKYWGDGGEWPVSQQPLLSLGFASSSAFAINRGRAGALPSSFYHAPTGPLSEQIIYAPYPLFTGTIDQWSPSPNYSGPLICSVYARDNIKNLRERTVTTTLFLNYNVGSLFTEVINAAEISSASIDTTADVAPFAWYTDRNAQNAIGELIESGFYTAFVNGRGIINVKRRYFEIQGTVISSLSEFLTLETNLNDDRVYNSVLIEGQPRRQNTTQQTLAYIQDPIFVAGSAQVNFFLQYLDPENNEPVPAINMVTPVQSLDWKMNTLSGGGGTDRTSTGSVSTTFFGETAKNTIFNGHPDPVYLNTFVLRGEPVQRVPRFSVRTEDSSSQALYGDKKYSIINPLIAGAAEAADYGAFLVNRNKNAISQIGFGLSNEYPQVLQAELADVYHVTNSFLGISSNQVIYGVSHAIDLTVGLQHQVIYTTDQFNDQDVLVLDDPALGLLDSRRLGY